MSLVISLNNTDIDNNTLKRFPFGDEKVAFNNRNLIAARLDIELDNTDRTIYDDRYSGSLFFGVSWRDTDVTVWDTDALAFIFKGRMKNLVVDDRKDTLTVKASNYIQDLATTPCVKTNTANWTPANRIYEILTSSTLGAIPAANVNFSGFQEADNIQIAASVYTNIIFTLEDNKSCMDVINELLRMSNCELFSQENIIHLWQWRQYSGALGTVIRKRDVLTKQYRHWFEDKNMANDYQILYDNAGTATAKTGSDATQIAAFGKKTFLVPNQAVDSTTTADFKLLYKSVTAATWAGENATYGILTRYKYLKKHFDITVGDEFDYVKVGEQIDLDEFDNFVREPCRITEKKHSRDKRTINFKGYFLNTPNSYFARDTEAPGKPELIEVLPMNDGGLVAIWTLNTESDYVGNRIYYTTTRGEWYIEESNLGKSPVQVITSNLTVDGYLYQKFYQLTSGATYHFKVTSYDTSLNESEYSNIVSATTLASALIIDNFYMTQGDPFIASITLDVTNALSGTVPSGFTPIYDDGTYGDETYNYNAFYESNVIRSDDPDTPITTLKVKGVTTSGIMNFQYRSWDGSDFGAWSTAVSAIGVVEVTISSFSYIQVRALFGSSSWADSDNFVIQEIS